MQKRVTVVTAEESSHGESLQCALKEAGFLPQWYIPARDKNFLITDDFWSDVLDTDLIYYRSGFGSTGAHLLWRRAQEKGVRFINETVTKNNMVSDKQFQASLVSPLDYVKLPKTILGKLPYDEVVGELGSPFVVKAGRGVKGEKVFLVHSREDYENAISGLRRIVLQQFIKNSGDYRVFVIDDEVHGVFKRVQNSDDFRSNIACGAVGQKLEDTDVKHKLQEVGVKLAALFELEVCGVDLMQSEEDGEFYFIEINASPNWEGLDATLGTNTPKAIVEFVKAKFAIS